MMKGWTQTIKFHIMNPVSIQIFCGWIHYIPLGIRKIKIHRGFTLHVGKTHEIQIPHALKNNDYYRGNARKRKINIIMEYSIVREFK